MEECEKLYSNQPNLSLCKTKNEAIHGSDGLIIATEWKAFQSPDFSMLKQSLKSPVIFDGRNLYDPDELEELGFSYYAIGRSKKISTYRLTSAKFNSLKALLRSNFEKTIEIRHQCQKKAKM